MRTLQKKKSVVESKGGIHSIWFGVVVVVVDLTYLAQSQSTWREGTLCSIKVTTFDPWKVPLRFPFRMPNKTPVPLKIMPENRNIVDRSIDESEIEIYDLSAQEPEVHWGENKRDHIILHSNPLSLNMWIKSPTDRLRNEMMTISSVRVNLQSNCGSILFGGCRLP